MLAYLLFLPFLSEQFLFKKKAFFNWSLFSTSFAIISVFVYYSVTVLHKSSCTSSLYFSTSYCKCIVLWIITIYINRSALSSVYLLFYKSSNYMHLSYQATMAEGKNLISPRFFFLKEKQTWFMSYLELSYFLKLENFK